MKKIAITSMALVAALLAGCTLFESATEFTVTTIDVSKEDTLTEYIIDSFSESYYSVSELTSNINAQLTEYNTGEEAAITLETVEQDEEKQIHVTLTYATAEDYAAFNNTTMFVGTVSEAYSAGYTFPDMVSVEDDSTVAASDILEQGEKHIIITGMATDVHVSGKILYHSSEVTVSDKKTATIPGTTDLSYVIYE